MSEICKDCLSKITREHITDADVIMDYEELSICEECGELRPCVIRYRKWYEKVAYKVSHIGKTAQK